MSDNEGVSEAGGTQHVQRRAVRVITVETGQNVMRGHAGKGLRAVYVSRQCDMFVCVLMLWINRGSVCGVQQYRTMLPLVGHRSQKQRGSSGTEGVRT